ncbi:MAG: tRNA 2-thiouridine(34) synthase MnmA [Gammaproteobacteria bacterium]
MARYNVIVGLSGGVDSALAGLRLKAQGHTVSGLFMNNWEDDDTDVYCSSREDLSDAVAVAEHLGIEVDAVNFTREYHERVFARFLEGLRAGYTPNPDVWCNSEIKFKSFLDSALARGADRVATGHYARVQERDGGYGLLKGADTGKDQSYFLYALSQAALSRVLFPVGELNKREVRAQAAAAGLSVHDKPDSTGICFVGERPFRAFLARYLPLRPGLVRSAEGRVLGEHQGVPFYTLGQRQGLSIGGVRGAMEAPWYVAVKDLVANELIVVQDRRHPLLSSRSLVASGLHWVSGTPPDTPLRCRAKTRYRQPDQGCTVVCIEDGQCRVEFEDEQWAVTPGQSVVFYQGETCLGGGTIELRR